MALSHLVFLKLVTRFCLTADQWVSLQHWVSRIGGHILTALRPVWGTDTYHCWKQKLHHWRTACVELFADYSVTDD